MGDFQPSRLSPPASAPLNYGADLSWLGPAISAVGSVASTAVVASGAKRAQTLQFAHEQEMAQEQAQLYALRIQAGTAQTAANRAASSLQAMLTTKTLLIVGGVVLTIGLFVAAFVAVRRGGDEE